MRTTTSRWFRGATTTPRCCAPPPAPRHPRAAGPGHLTGLYVCSRHTPRYADLDDEDQHLLRAAYDTPAYDHEYQEDDDMPLDLLKDGLWAVKAKIKELKAFNKALAANFLSTKLKVKELIAASLALKNHHHGEVEKKKPAYNYQAPSYQPQYGPQYAETNYAPQYAEPQYAPPQPQQHDPYYGH